MCFADNLERKIGKILSHKNVTKVGKEKKTTPQKDAQVGKRRQTRKRLKIKIITQNQSGKRLERPLPHKKKLKSQRKKLERL